MSLLTNPTADQMSSSAGLVARAQPDDKVQIILPKAINSDGSIRAPAETLTLPDVAPAAVAEILTAHYIQHPDPYTGLYDSNGALNVTAVNRLFASRRWARAIPFERANQNADLDGRFDGDPSFHPMIPPLVALLQEEVGNADREFRLRNEGEREIHCDSQRAPKPALVVESDVTAFLEVHGHAEGAFEKVVNASGARKWINGPLRDDLGTIADLAIKDKIVYHEPHHELTPGMLLIDEIFRRMVKEVVDLMNRINDGSEGVEALSAFVNSLAGDGGGPGSNFAPYIHPAGERPIACAPHEDPFHVDPARIELIVSPAGIIRAACVIVGAWKGGTHSAGHTSP